VGNLVSLASDRFNESAGKLVARRKTDRMHQHVEAVPFLAEPCHYGIDFFVAADIAGEQEIGILAQPGGELGPERRSGPIQANVSWTGR
jgi:hypothetical protein